ncbi:MAG: hypothetical protein KIT14_10180 [bacterium]|nr:hypothetical protein [bacterium]
MARTARWIVVAAALLLPVAASAQPQGKCVAGKTKCVANKFKGLLKCHQLAETPGKPTDPNAKDCVTKAKAKFDGGATPAKGCFEKLEGKTPNDCVTFDDTAALEAAVDACVDQLVAAVDPPPTTQSKCNAGKKSCMSKKVGGLLKCYAKAQTPGKPNDPNAAGCVDKVVAKFEHPTTGCFAKLEAKNPADCETLGNAASVESLIDACVQAIVDDLAPSSTTTTVGPATTTTSTVPATTTTTVATTSTTTSTTSTTSTTAPPANPTSLDFIAATGTGLCGDRRRNDLTVLSDLECNKLYIGGGNATVTASTNPSGVVNRIAITGCTGNSCTLGPTLAQTGPSNSIECTNTGCFFGSPVAIPNFGTSSCVINTFATPVSGTLDVSTGVTTNLGFNLQSATYVTGNNTQPCPICVTAVPGGAFAPQPGTCDRGARKNMACISSNPQGLSRDCQPLNGEVDPGTGQATQFAGNLAVNLSPLTTGTRTETRLDPNGGLFCPGQGAGQRGCFLGGNTCRQVNLSGAPSGSLLPIGTTAQGRFASIFCIPSSTSALLNVGANLPGPGATTIVADLRLNP